MRRAALIPLLSLFIAHAAFAIEPLSEEAAMKWLQRMSHALHELNYDGDFVYAHGDQLTAMRIIHANNELGEQERLVSLTGSAREVIRDNDQVTCILPDTRSVIVERKGQSKPGFPYILPKGIKPITDVYHFELGEQGRITGRDAQQVRILPRDEYRYSYHLWLDRETGMLLKAELINGEATVEQFMFTRLEFMKTIPDGLFAPDVDRKDFLSFHHERRKEKEAVATAEQDWRVLDIPAGFELMRHQYQYQTDRMEPVHHLVYSDGLSTVSIFIERLGAEQEPIVGPSPMGAVNAYSTLRENTQITAVGEVPEATVKRMAESVEFRGR
ncbi:MAG: MucB/RseB C-terminal domain-containing protein [Gammaproteobacteria bacterium]|nr:MucB/RseB C-terminal domain-containing protein [Gammaproteobacteria bacterium]